MKKFGLIGFPLSHSFSKAYFTDKFENLGLNDFSYELYELKDIALLSELIQNENLSGFNVTIPHKINILPFINSLDNDALEASAVNCVKVENVNGKLILNGYNTDVYGFTESLRPLLKPEYKKALILGNGGASKAVQVALKNLDIPYSIVSRSGQLYYNDVSVKTIADHQIIINTTPLGMFPDSNSYPPIPYESISNKHLAYDLVYNPDKTVFLEKCEAKGATIKGGLEMLHLQAERSWDIFKM